MKNKLLKIMSLALVMLVSVVGAFLVAPVNTNVANADSYDVVVHCDEKLTYDTLDSGFQCLSG